MENRQIMPNSNEPLTPTTTQQNFNNSLDPFYNQSFFTLRGSNNRLQDIQSETFHPNPLNFDFFRPQRPLRSNLNNARPQAVPIFVSNQNSNLNFLNPLHNLSVESRNFWDTESLLQNIERTTPRFIPYNTFSPHILRRVTDPDLLSVTLQEPTPFIPTSRFRALPFASISSVSLPPITSFDSPISIMTPLTIPHSSSAINLPASIEVPSTNSGDEVPLTANANIITINVSVQTEPMEPDQKEIIKFPKRKADEELPENLRKKNRRRPTSPSDTTNNDKIFSVNNEFSMTIDSDEKKHKICEELEEQPLRRSARIANDKQKRVVFYDTLSQLLKKRKRISDNVSNDKVESDETPKRRRGRPRKEPVCGSRGKQAKATSLRNPTEEKIPLRRSERLSMKYKANNKKEI